MLPAPHTLKNMGLLAGACGESPGATRFFSHERDADDLAACVRHLREERCLEVAGIVGLGGGGTAYADLRLEPLADEL